MSDGLRLPSSLTFTYVGRGFRLDAYQVTHGWLAEIHELESLSGPVRPGSPPRRWRYQDSPHATRAHALSAAVRQVVLEIEQEGR